MYLSPVQATLNFPSLGTLLGSSKLRDVGPPSSILRISLAPNLSAPAWAQMSSLINGYESLNWANLYAFTPSPVVQFVLPQGKIFAGTLAGPNLNTATITATTGSTFTPISVFVGTFSASAVGGAAALSTAIANTVTATFSDATTRVTTFNLMPPNTVLGLALNAEAMQSFQFPCDWDDVVSLAFVPHSANNANTGLELALDNLEIDGYPVEEKWHI